MTSVLMRVSVFLIFWCSLTRAQDADELFRSKCAVCHNARSTAGAPLPEALRQMPWKRILEALETGKMRAMGASMSEAERLAVAKHLGVAESTQAMPASALCSSSPAPKMSGLSWSGWGADAVNSRFQSAQSAGLSREQTPRLKLKWAFGFPGVATAFSQPSTFGGRLYVGSADGTVYSLDAQSGCVHWTYAAGEGVRTALVVSSDGQTLYFGDLHANAFAVNATTGALLWKTHVDEHPFAVITGTPKLEGGRLYVPVSAGDEPISASNSAFECCSFRGSLVALDAATGKQIWKTYTISGPAQQTGVNSAGAKIWGPSGASLWSSPTLDLQKRVIYMGTGINFTAPSTPYSDAIVAFDMDSGRILWAQQLTAGDVYNFGCQGSNRANCPKDPGKDADFGNSPMLQTLAGGRRILVVGQKSGMVHALDPDAQGKILWQTRISSGGPQGGVIWGGASDQTFAYFGVSDWNPRMPEAGGGLFALELATGHVAWSTPAPKPTCISMPGCSAAQPAPVSAIPGVLFLGSMDGHMRAYDAKDGKIIWDFDTLRDFETVNGVKAHGGSLDAAGPAIANGILYTNSGYARIPSMPGNVLLAFSVDGK